MSSLVRRLQIRVMKRSGYRRSPFRLVREPDGQVRLDRVRKGGLIVDPKGDPIGIHWPARIPVLV